MKKLIQATILLIGSSTLFSGCASMLSQRDSIYPGVSYDLDVMAGKPIKRQFLEFRPDKSCAPVDLPFSFALDTVLLPIDIIRSVPKGSSKESSTPPPN